MAIQSDQYLHDSDRAALNALKAIPGFTPVLKAFMSFWNEIQFKILNLSSNLRLGENQMQKYYDMLPPICERLGIDIPELYVELNVVPNAYTYGDTKPFIVLTSGLLTAFPEELIPTVLAHECGHIACRHTLYRTMGSMLLGGVEFLPGITSLITLPLKIAFFYWMRCSELSADRAASLCDGSSDKTVEMCMRFAGYDKNIEAEVSRELFMEQALEYREMIKGNALNKTMEFMLLSTATHPFMAVRAYEINEWGQLERFKVLCEDLPAAPEPEKEEPEPLELTIQKVTLPFEPRHYVGMDHTEVELLFRALGFTDLEFIGTREKGLLTKPGQVTKLTINGASDLRGGCLLPADAAVCVVWYDPQAF